MLPSIVVLIRLGSAIKKVVQYIFVWNTI